MLETGSCSSGDEAVENPQPKKRQYTLKGVESEAIDLMRAAAGQEGMKISAWVSQRLREAAEASLNADSFVVGSQEEHSEGSKELLLRVRRLEKEVEELNHLQRLLIGRLLTTI